MKYLFLLFILICFILPVNAAMSIHQGDNVYLNDTIDISGVIGIGINKLAYYGSYSDTPMYILDITNPYSFYINPVIFKTKIGNWYKWEGNITNSHGNDIVFSVINKERNNITVINTSDINITDAKPSITPLHIADYVVARGDPLIIKVSSPAKGWIFGEMGGVYNVRSESGVLIFDKYDIDSLKPDTYILLIQYTGINGEFNSIYNKEAQSLETLVSSRDGWNISSENVKTITPMKLLEKVKESINKTDDTYELFTLNIKFPFIDIRSRDSYDNGYFGEIIVTGYTNVAEGTQMKFYVVGVPTINANTTTISTKNQGDLRYFIARMPFNYKELSYGNHFITGTVFDISQTVSFHVYELPAGSQPRNTTTKYINGSEWLVPPPTPTPEVITVIETQIVEKEVIKEKIVTITPDTGMIYDNQKKANDKTIFEVVSGVAALFIGGYIISVIFRGMKNE